MAVGVLGEEVVEGCYYAKNGQRYYYLKISATGWHIDEVPDDCEDV